MTPASRSGVRSRKRSSGPATRGYERPASSARCCERDRGVLERLALDQAGEEQVALGPQGSSSSRSRSSSPGSRRRVFSSISVAAISRNSVATSRSKRSMRVELGQVGVDDLRERDLVELDLLAQDQVQQQVEGPFEDRRWSPRRASSAMLITSVWFREPVRAAGRLPPTHRPLWPASSPASSPPASSHLGTYLGALRRFVDRPGRARLATSASSTCTPSRSPRTRRLLRRRTLETAALYLASGLDPDACTLFVQSHVRRAHRAGLAAWSAPSRSAS